MTRALLLVLTSILCGLGGTYLVRAALVDVGGFTLGGPVVIPKIHDGRT